MKYENNICSTWLENQGENFIDTKVNDVYYDYLLYCKNNKLKFSNEWEGIHE